LSAGFIEPLEASALVLIELSANALADRMPHDRATMQIVAKRFNAEFLGRWRQIIDFLKLHYVLSARSDSRYWRDNRLASSIPDTLRENLSLWQTQPPWYHDDMRRDDMFPAASYQYVLYGMGFKTNSALHTLRNDRAQREQAIRLFSETRKKAQRFGQHLPPNRYLMDQVRTQDFSPV